MKFIKDEDYASLKAKADNYDKVVATVVGNNDGISAEDVTPEVISSAISNDAGVDSATVNNLNSQVSKITAERDALKAANETLTTENSTLQSEVEELKADNKELSLLPGAKSVSSKKDKKESSTVETDDLLAFANAHKGDTLAIAAKMRETGYY